MNWREAGQTIGEIVMHADLNLKASIIVEKLIKRFRDEYMLDAGFDEKEFYRLCDPNDVFDLFKPKFQKFSKVTTMFDSHLAGEGYIIDDKFANPDERLVFWVGGAGNPRGTRMLHVVNLKELPE